MDQIKVKGNLTPEFINRSLGPFLESLTNLQHIIDEMRQSSPAIIKVLEVSGLDTASENENHERELAGLSRPVQREQFRQALHATRETIDSLDDEPALRSIKEETLKLADVRLKLLNLLLSKIQVEANQPVEYSAKLYQPSSMDELYEILHLGYPKSNKLDAEATDEKFWKVLFGKDDPNTTHDVERTESRQDPFVSNSRRSDEE